MHWRGYVLVEKPPVLSAVVWRAGWETEKAFLGVENQSPQPARRLHGRYNLAGSADIIEGVFEVEQLVKTPGAKPFEGSYLQSQRAARQYVADHAPDWEPKHDLSQ
jgi:hypothetical protein